MKGRLFRIIIIIETGITIFVIADVCVCFAISGKTVLYSEESPDGNYICTIVELGKPGVLYDDLKISLLRYEDLYRSSFEASVSNGGYPADFEVEWTGEGVLITLIGSKQPTAYYFLPFAETVENEGYEAEQNEN
ncbi:MAG: hypothetical protein LUC95_01410 [Lachnospiraceae bacterium]|nr:hypothetical protein [Lachnospiraceae bacterium]